MINLDIDQRKVCDISPDIRQLVIAGPGAGKTTVVGALVEELVAKGLDGAGEILVISFSRAAVNAVRSRLSEQPNALRAVVVRTIDALARRIVFQESDIELSQSFDGTVKEATRILVGGNGADQFDDVRHLIVDEVQDLGATRSAFISGLIDVLGSDCGVTALGDPLQSIFGFGNDDKFTWDELVTDLESKGVERTTELHGSYRFDDGDPRQASELGAQLRNCQDRSKQAEMIGRFVPQLARLPINVLTSVSARWEGSTAVLARSNGAVLEIATALHAANVKTTIVRSANERSCAPWVAKLVDATGGRAIERSQFDQFVQERIDVPDGAWRALRRATGGGRAVSVQDLSTAIRLGRIPVELESTPAPTALRISTIHKAKGLEFDNVAILDVDALVSPARAETGFLVEDAFVALTRARKRLARLVHPEMPKLGYDKATQRWYRAGYKSWQTFGFELRGPDVISGVPMLDQESIQSYIHAKVSPGDAVQFFLDPQASTLTLPVYEIVHENTLVARTTDMFGTALARRLGGPRSKGRPWPDLGSGGFIEAIETMAGQPRLESPSAAISSGLWLGVRVMGMVELKW